MIRPPALLPAGLLRLVQALRQSREGVTALEFTLIAPVFLMLIMGIFDLGQMGYGLAVLNGAVQKAARDSSLETANTLVADNMVKSQVGAIFPGAIFSSTRTSYFDFTDIGRPEHWNDADGNGACNNGEAYVDENDNGQWDADIGDDGNGGASDVVVYRFTVKYNPVFAVPFMPSQWNQRTLTATAIRKNQPFAYQSGYGTTAGTCP